MEEPHRLHGSNAETGAEEFRRYLNQSAQTARKVFARYPQHALDEQAGPAYLQGLALSRWVFWRRLEAVFQYLAAGAGTCLDFGCGMGLLLPFLSRRFEQVVGVDLMPGPAREFLKQWEQDYADPIPNVLITADLDKARLAEDSVDAILALDVLEHVDNLPQILDSFGRLLKPQGQLLVSGPTENWLYKLGRRIVGFSGHYHVRNIHDITGEMHRHFDVRLAKRIGFPLSLFHILSAAPRA